MISSSIATPVPISRPLPAAPPQAAAGNPDTPAAPTSAPATATSVEGLDERGSASRLLRYANQCPIPLIGSGAQTWYALHELRAARTHNAGVNARVDLGNGVASMLNDASQIAMMARAVMPAALVAVAGPINGVTGIICGAADGGRDLYNAHTQHVWGDYVAGGVKIGASILGAYGAFTGNMPIFYLSNVIYFGAVAGQNWDSVKSAVHYVTHPVEMADAVVHFVKKEVHHHEEHGQTETATGTAVSAVKIRSAAAPADGAHVEEPLRGTAQT
ncbi:MAG: hypothetical protein ACYCW6_11585 [Candidatus Xenobia bacterium]